MPALPPAIIARAWKDRAEEIPTKPTTLPSRRRVAALCKLALFMEWQTLFQAKRETLELGKRRLQAYSQAKRQARQKWERELIPLLPYLSAF